MQARLQNIPMGQRIALALALPMAGFLFFVVWVLASHQRTANDMRSLREMAELASFAGLTTIRQPMQQMGSEAAQLVLALMNGELLTKRQRQLPLELVIRQSCGAVQPIPD